jgi:hypothetical protein
MTGEILRPALLAVGGGLVAVGVLLSLGGCPTGLALEAAIPGLIIAGGVLFERWRYRPLDGDRPGPDWIATGERFVDPETSKMVTVFYKPTTGERRYVGR